jgi:L-threonylcarbamoyladenylate synthase
MTAVGILSTLQSAHLMRAGAVIAYPTEAVYGLGCDPDNEKAVRHLLSLKQRSPDAGLILIADDLPDWLAGKHPSIALRVTAHPVCRELCALFGGAIVSSSANLSGQAAPRSRQEVASCFPEGLAGIVEGELGGRELPSEIRDLATGQLIRAG